MKMSNKLLKGNALKLLDVMENDAGGPLPVTDKQAIQLNLLCKNYDMKLLETLAIGEVQEQERIAKSSPGLRVIHRILEEIFNA
jgi:hypothetical protein